MFNKSGRVYACISDRLGNQLFQYAFARALQLKFYPSYKLTFNTHSFEIISENDRAAGWRDQLKDFNIYPVDYVHEYSRYQMFIRAIARGLTIIFSKFTNWRTSKTLAQIVDRLGFYRRMGCLMAKPRKSLSSNIFCIGNFENYNYFNDIRDILLKEFTPKKDLLPENFNLMSEIQNTNSVCVSIRRGDFLIERNERLNVCNAEYFSEAMHRIKAQIPDCKFFIFTDDVEDVKNNFKFPYNVTFESGNDPVWEKLRLMYSCKHFIIANSTFSWWAQYLSRNENKIVYVPEPWHWHSDFDDDNFDGVYLPYMIKIKCSK